MASITILYRGVRESVKATPATTLGKILEDTCKKKNLSCDGLGFKHKEKFVDLSLPYRLSGLAPGAVLEICRRNEKDAQVTIALQLPNGQRLQQPFSSSTTLLNVLHHFEEATNTNLVRLETNGKYQQPVITILNREISTNKELRELRLATVGISGSSLIRLSYKDSNMTLEQVIKQEEEEKQEKEKQEKEKQEREKQAIEKQEKEKKDRQAREEEEREKQMKMRAREQQEREEEEKRRAAQASQLSVSESKKEDTSLDESPPVQSQPTLQQPKSQPESQRPKSPLQLDSPLPLKYELDPIPMSDVLHSIRIAAAKQPKAVIQPVERNIQILPPHCKPLNPASLAVTESDDSIEPTGQDLKRLMEAERAKKKREEEDKFLKTKELKEKERLDRLKHIKRTHIRVRFPDLIELQATFNPLETINELVSIVKESLASDLPFYLYTAPPKERVKNTARFIDVGLIPAAIVHFAWETNVPNPPSVYLKEEVLSKLVRPQESSLPTTIPSPSPTLSSSSSYSTEPSAKREKHEHRSASSSSSSSSSSSLSDAAKRSGTPKWFMTGKKL